MKFGSVLLEKFKGMTLAGPNPIEPSPATTGLMNFQWKPPFNPVGIKVHLMVFSGICSQFVLHSIERQA